MSLEQLNRQAMTWTASGVGFGAARLIAADGPGAYPVGSTMLVADSGEIFGSIAGGCIDSAVVDAVKAARIDGACRLLDFGPLPPDDPFSIGSSCGCTSQVLITSTLGAWLAELARAIGDRVPAVLVTVVSPPDPFAGTAPVVHMGDCGGQVAELSQLGQSCVIRSDGVPSAGPRTVDVRILAGATTVLSTNRPVRVRFPPSSTEDAHSGAGTLEVVIEPVNRSPRMVIVGPGEIAANLVDQANLLGYFTTVCDARVAYLRGNHFAAAREVVGEWPDRFLERIRESLGPDDAVCVLSHEERFDVPAVREALLSRAGYVGLIGSRATIARREAALRARGVPQVALDRLHAPIGLDIGASTPAETALAVLAEVIAARRGRSGGRLRDRTGPIHPRPRGTISAPEWA